MKETIILLTLIVLEMGTSGQTTYIWTGSVNSNFSTAGNWSPSRQVGLASDIMIFNSGTVVEVNNVNQVTVGRIVVSNNTQVRFSPAPGNPKVISIQGNGGDSHGIGNNNNNTDNPNQNEQTEISDSKYNEYMVSELDKAGDLASEKYKEYMQTEITAPPTDVASQKYTEYQKPPTTGMGDIKKIEEQESDSPDNDFMVDAGSSITLSGNDPKLGIFLKAHTTSSISGSIILTGGIGHTINSNDPYSIAFKAGSTLVQTCPGNVFTTTGVNNSAMFESGSTLVINNSEAMDPSGMTAPSSKVTFSEGSTLRFDVSNSNALSLSGRNFSNVTVNNNSEVDVNENIVTDCLINNLLINQGGKLTIRTSSNTNTPALNIKGNITVNGTLEFPENSQNRINLNLNGNTVQEIRGTGNIDINYGVYTMTIDNDITFYKDLTVYCNVVHNNGVINTNGHQFRIFNKYSSRQMLPVGVIMMQPENETEKLSKDKQSNNTTSNIPKEFTVGSYPNPFNPTTTIKYEIPADADVTVKIYDITGKEAASLVSTHQTPGKYTTLFNASNLASGVYFCRIIAKSGYNEKTKVLKLLLAK